MKMIITICMLLIMTISAHSQKKSFIRIFDLNGTKTHKGNIVDTSDSSLTVSLNKNRFEIPVIQIGKIKLKRSFGHTVFITTAITSASLAILGVVTADPSAWIFGYTAAQGAILGIMSGVTFGVPVGSIIAATSNRPEFIIDGKQDQWIKAKEVLKKY